MTELQIFEKASWECSICVETKKGHQFIHYSPCGHHFCQDCVRENLEFHIRDGNIKNLTCPESDCNSTLLHHQIQNLVGDALFARYDKLLLLRTLEGMKDILLCPRKACAIPMIVDEDSIMATCPNCEGTFCMLCHRTYHGLESCRINLFEKQKLALKYKNGSPTERAELERIYGKKTLKLLVDEYLSENFISENSKKCPNCGANIIKEDGCHKMWCTKCQVNFCWLCMAILDPYNPYSHFNEIGGSCLNRLFFGLEIEDDEDEEALNFEEFL